MVPLPFLLLILLINLITTEGRFLHAALSKKPNITTNDNGCYVVDPGHFPEFVACRCWDKDGPPAHIINACSCDWSDFKDCLCENGKFYNQCLSTCQQKASIVYVTE